MAEAKERLFGAPARIEELPVARALSFIRTT